MFASQEIIKYECYNNVYLKNYEGVMYRISLSLLFTLTTAVWAGDMSQCNSISDGDQRQMCRAQASRVVSKCGFIQNNDLRYMCTAQVGNRRSDCGFIQNGNLRATCQATAR